jgi:hypothetical protein
LSVQTSRILYYRCIYDTRMISHIQLTIVGIKKSGPTKYGRCLDKSSDSSNPTSKFTCFYIQKGLLDVIVTLLNNVYAFYSGYSNRDVATKHTVGQYPTVIDTANTGAISTSPD